MNPNSELLTTETEVKQISEHDQLRADIYQLLAALFRQGPNQSLIEFLATLEIDDDNNEMSQAWLAVKNAAKQTNVEQLEDEYFAIFLGVGCGEILPYGSWFITGSLLDKPLALLRQDLKQLGYERNENIVEPEDHISALFEVLAHLIIEQPNYRQLAFYQRHLESWIQRFCNDLSKAPSANFYVKVALLAKAFFDLETITFEQLSLNCNNLN